MATSIETTPRKPGRPLGSVDLHGKARRVSARAVDPYLARIGQRVHDARIERDISVSELGLACRMSQFTIFMIEAGRTLNPGVGTLVRIALALGVQPSELIP